MQSGRARRTLINPWGVSCSARCRRSSPKALGAGGVRQVARPAIRPRVARSDRTHGAEGVIPTPLWIVLFLSAGIIFVFMLFFADSGERASCRGR